ncbi:MAG: flagellar type III secretion system pore protein FliP [Myxococcota bacterium]
MASSLRPSPASRAEPSRGLGRPGALPFCLLAAFAALLLAGFAQAQTPDAGVLGQAVADLEKLTENPSRLAPVLRLAVLMTVLSLAPALVMMVTCFVRVVVVLTLLRQAIGVQNVPPTQVLVALSLFLTIFVMQPTFEQAYSTGVGPFLRGEVEDGSAFEASVAPFRSYMLRQTRSQDLLLFNEIAEREAPETPDELSLAVLIPAYMLSELRTAFLIGFMLFLPFLVIDMVVASTLLSMGMIVVPPMMIALPLKLMIFVLVDGWNLIVGAIVRGIL